MPLIEVPIVDQRVVRMRDIAESDPDLAQEEAWSWIVELGQRVHSRRDTALPELAGLFATGKPSRMLDGRTEARLVSAAVHPLLDRLIATAAQAWMPWLGTLFDAIHHRGINLVSSSAWLPAKLLWPLYRMARSSSGLLAFEFTSRVEPSVLDRDQDVLVMDYASVAENPWLLVRALRGELVEIVPGIHLGKALLRVGTQHGLLAYFALRVPPM